MKKLKSSMPKLKSSKPFQPFNFSTFQPFNFSTFQPFNRRSQPFDLSTFRLFTLSTALLAACSVSAKTFQWRITGNETTAGQFAAYHGETVAFDLSFSGAASNCTASSARIFYQTNGMGGAYWPTDGLVFAPSNDCGAAAYRFFVRATDDLGVNYTANGILRMLDSPGFVPNALPLPVATIDFARVSVSNAPWATPDMIDYTPGNAQLVETIAESETDPTVPAWAKAQTPPQTMTTNDVCNIVTNQVDEYVMEMEGDYWMVEQTTARFVIRDVVWTPRGDGQYTVTFRANGESKSIDYPDSVANSVICTDRGCYLYFSYEQSVSELMPELSMPNQWALVFGSTGGHDGGADSFVHRVGNALGLATANDLAALSGSATNYTDTATNALRVSFAGDLAAAISATNTVFSNAVLSVGLGIDTNAVAAINALVEQGDELPVGEAATVGALLLALAAAVAALKRGKADITDLSYALKTLGNSDIKTVGQVTGYALADRAVNGITVGSGVSSVVFLLPAKVVGRGRDLFIRLVVTGTSAPSVSFYEADGSAVSFDEADDSWADLEPGVNVICFTETSQA